MFFPSFLSTSVPTCLPPLSPKLSSFRVHLLHPFLTLSFLFYPPTNLPTYLSSSFISSSFLPFLSFLHTFSPFSTLLNHSSFVLSLLLLLLQPLFPFSAFPYHTHMRPVCPISSPLHPILFPSYAVLSCPLSSLLSPCRRRRIVVEVLVAVRGREHCCQFSGLSLTDNANFGCL